MLEVGVFNIYSRILVESYSSPVRVDVFSFLDAIKPILALA